MKITHVPSRLPTRAPWRLYHRGKIQWFWTEKAAQKEAEQITKNIGKMRARVSVREVDELIHCKELLKGTPLLRAVRYYLEAHSAALRNANQPCRELLTAFKATLRGRPKYVAEATRHLTLLAESIGKLKAGEVSHEHVERHLAQFESRWSHDDALKFICWMSYPSRTSSRVISVL